MEIAGRLFIPATTKAILWDMDGVLIDSLRLDLTVCNQILATHFGAHVKLDSDFIRAIFAYDIPKFWQIILQHVAETYQIPNALDAQPTIVSTYHQARENTVFETNPGILTILQTAQLQNIKMAVVSNNPTAAVKTTLQKAGIDEYFDFIVGNDLEKTAKKPAPDTYLLAARKLSLNPEDCVVIEDSLIGVEAGRRAGCYAVAVATGGHDYATLANSEWPQQTYFSFAENHLNWQFGNVKNKKIITPNDFVSHMIEHIAWRLCMEIDLRWQNDHWFALGAYLGQALQAFPSHQTQSAALGMIDDGSAEVTVIIDNDKPGEVVFNAIETLDLEWFLSLRCEQLDEGKPLVELLKGLTHGLNACIQITVCSVQDPHHTWEGIFRSIGIALSRIYTPIHDERLCPPQNPVEISQQTAELQILANSVCYSKVFRGTAESHVIVAVDFSQQMANQFVFNVASNIEVGELPKLLTIFAQAAGVTLQITYNATVLNSSHVVLEDTALVLGRALREILVLRMNQWGVNGAGSSIHTIADINASSIHTGISVEGRKFWLFVPFKDRFEHLKQQLLIGQDVLGTLRSEDLDDFLDGLSGGLGCSIVVHVHELTTADAGWQLIFQNLGKSLKEVFAYNPYRKGVPPGVKATLI